MAHTKVTKTYSQNTGVANTFSYSGSFDVFKGTEVVALLDGTSLTYTASTINESASPREYTVDTAAKTIHIGGANLSSGSIEIRPVTDMGAPTPRADYAPGSSVAAADLNNNQLQLMRKAMEYDEQKLSSTGGTMTGDLTMGQAKKIIFEGATDDAYETTLTVTDPTADRTITVPNVTGTVVTTGDTGTVTATMLAANSVDSSELVDGSIDSSHISSSAVTTGKIAADAVTGAKIADDAIDSEHYTDGSIDTVHIADANITTAKLVDNAVTTVKITDGNVTTAKIASSAVTNAKLGADCISEDKIADDAVREEHLADNAVTTARIANDAINGSKIADDAIDSEHYTDGSIDTAHIGDNQVTTAKIADANITTAKLATGAVTTAKITASAVVTDSINADAVTGAKIADDAINSEHYTDASIDTAHIADANVTTAKLASNAVTTAKITDSNVTTAKIADDAITIAKVGCEQTTISDSDSHIPTSGAVVDYVASIINPIGGLEVIADDESFPNTIPAAGVVISITDAAGLQVNSSGVSTNGDALDNSTITINGFPSELRGGVGSNADPYVFGSGAGLMVVSTGSSQTYNYHQAMIREADFVQLSDDINDFNSRYRIHAGEPSSNNDEGDLVFDTNADKMKVYDGSAWGEVTSTGDFKFLVPVDAGTTTAASWDGSDTSFDLKETTNSGSAASVTNINQLMVVLNGVVQKPNTGSYSASEEGFYLTDADTIRFCTAPPSNSTCFIIQSGSAVSIPTPGDGTVTAAKIGSGAVTTAKLADANVTLAKMASESVDEDNLHISNAGSNGQFLSKQTGNSGGLTWATVSTSDATKMPLAGGTFTGDVTFDNSTHSGFDISWDESEKYLLFQDGTKIVMGAGGDLSMYHDGSHSYLIDGGTGDLIINSNSTISLNPNSGGEYGFRVHSNGAVEGYYDNSKKFETTSTGITVTGDVTGTYPLGRRNHLINGSMRVAQYAANNTTINTYGPCDRWRSFGGALDLTISQQTSAIAYDSGYGLRVQRNNSTSQTNATGICQGLETKDSTCFAGKKVTLSFKAECGANYSPTSSLLVSQILTGEGTNQNPVSMTNTDSSNQNNTLSTSVQTFTHTHTIPDDKTQMTIAFQFNPTGTAGANDWFQIGDVQLEIGDATPFELRPYATELAECQHYYQKFMYATQTWIYNEGNAANLKWIYAEHGPMRESPTISFADLPTGSAYPAGHNDRTISSYSNAGDSGVQGSHSHGRVSIRITFSDTWGDAYKVRHTDGLDGKFVSFQSEL